MNTLVVDAPTADKMVELGAGVVRVPYGWDLIEPTTKGSFNWTTIDAWRDEARRTHRAIFGSLAFSPSWARCCLNGQRLTGLCANRLLLLCLSVSAASPTGLMPHRPGSGVNVAHENGRLPPPSTLPAVIKS